MKDKSENNIYLRIPLDQVRSDALNGVSLARQAWRIRQPKEAARALGHVKESSQQVKQK